MKIIVITLCAVVVAFAAGYYIGAQPRTCAYVSLNGGSGIVCSNSLSGWTRQ